MSKMIQIRNVPDDLHRKLKARAAQQGMTLSDYLLSEVTTIGERPTMQEMADRLARLEGPDEEFSSQVIVDIIRAHRGPLPSP